MGGVVALTISVTKEVLFMHPSKQIMAALYVLIVCFYIDEMMQIERLADICPRFDD